jgi:Cu(I)/Ag(I) efflux system membrane protein CusA/SilA
VLARVLAYPKATVAIALVLLAATAWPILRTGGEFMPPLDEGDLLYMPSALPGLSAGKAAQLLQQTDRLIKTVPEVATVFGKAGRADTATDPAPLEMFETTIQFKPRDQWRPGMTPDKLVDELDRVVKTCSRSTGSPRRSRRQSRRCPASPPRWRSGFPAGAISTSTSTARLLAATA